MPDSAAASDPEASGKLEVAAEAGEVKDAKEKEEAEIDSIVVRDGAADITVNIKDGSVVKISRGKNFYLANCPVQDTKVLLLLSAVPTCLLLQNCRRRLYCSTFS